MSKNIKLNNKAYNGISTVELPTTDGATATFKDVDEIQEGGGGYSESNSVTFTGEIQGVVGGAASHIGIRIEHGLSQTPKFAIMTSNAAVDGTVKGNVIAGTFSELIVGYSAAVSNGGKFADVYGTNVNTGNLTAYAAVFTELSADSPVSTCVWYWDSTAFYCLKPASNQTFSPNITYTITFYA